MFHLWRSVASILVENSSSCAAAVAQIIDITNILILHGILDSRLLFPGVLRAQQELLTLLL